MSFYACTVVLLTLVTVAFSVSHPRSFKHGGISNTVSSKRQESNHPTSANCTWVFVEQPLSHFVRGIGGTYKERLCVYSQYWTPHVGAPVFFYTGNESPVEEYINNTGLIWDLAAEEGALVVFAEHRYFGESIPEIKGMPNCMAYLSSQEALADYATVISTLRSTYGAKDSAFIAFGGSYGGMLASWMRMVYPSSIDGAISASAPIWGFPLDSCPIDGSARTVTFAASPSGGCAENCADNLKASYVLISDIAKSAAGRDLLTSSMGLCTPLRSAQDVPILLQYLQSPLFNLAEGSYPFATDYITFALTYSTIPLPAWPMRVMCDEISRDYGVKITGNASEVVFDVVTEAFTVNVNWDTTTSHYDVSAIPNNVLNLVHDVAQAIQIWYNLTGTETCIAWNGEPAPNANKDKVTMASTEEASSDNVCTMDKSEFTAGDGWNALTCNEGLNLINWWVQGVGNDLYWPPNQPKGYTMENLITHSLDYCKAFKTQGLYGFPEVEDVYSKWEDTVYGGTRLQYATNIIFTNGNLDPWTPAGVHLEATAHDASIQSLIIDQGGHHLDLFFPTEEDPASVKEVRDVERSAIKSWIKEVADRHKK